MGILKKVWYSFILLVFLQDLCVSGTDDCSSWKCNNNFARTLEIRFPFRLKDRQPENCGYPGFELSCSKDNETILDLPFAGSFFVNSINYKSQEIEINDPSRCLPMLLLNFNLSDSPFRSNQRLGYNSTVLNCSSTDSPSETETCPSSSSSSTYRVISDYPSEDLKEWHFEPKCKPLGTVLVQYRDFLSLKWDKPECEKCESDGGKCRYRNYNTSSLAIACLRVLPPPPLHPKGESRKKIAIGVSLCIFVCLVVCALVVIRALKQRDTEEKGYQLNIENFLENYKGLKPTRYTYAEIKRITNKFNSKLGQGGYGTVFEGKLLTKNGVKVAVKILNKTQGNGEDFINEVGTIGRIHHINVVQLLGFCADGSERALIYEFMPNQSLDKFIFARDDRKPYLLGWGKLQDIAIGTARGIEYLHQGCDQRILHFDIKPQNILLDNNFNPKISDFGLAKLSSKGESIVPVTAARGTMGYIAPEVFSREFGNVSSKSDVYSFGMLLLEMVGGRKNTEVKVEKASQVYFPEWIYYRLDKGEDLGIQLDIEEDATIAKKLTMVALWCVQWHPMDRPSMKAVIQMLEGNFENLIMPPNPFRSTAPTQGSTTKIPEITPHKELTLILEE